MITRALSLAGDLLLVLVFATVGRASHAEGLTVTGILETGWPFGVGVLAGHALLLVRRAPTVSLPGGLAVWVLAVGLGMLLHRLTDHGTDPAFVVVATLFLGATLLGWRLVAWVVARRLAE